MSPGWGRTAAAGGAATLLAVALGRALARQAPGEPRLTTGTAEQESPPVDLRLSVLVPAFMEEARISATVGRITRAVAPVAAEGGVEIVVVDDGSSDSTVAEAEAAGARVLRQPVNRGKGAAVRTGMLAARGATVAFVDADLAYPPEQVLELLTEVEAGWDVVVGSRHHPGSTSLARESRLRLLSGRLFNVVTSALVLDRRRDTQCGCKAFRADAARLIFSQARIDGFAFDVEVFLLARRHGLTLTEVPVTLVGAAGSTVHLGVDAVRMARDLLHLRRWSRQGAYDAQRPSVADGPAGGG